MPIVVRSLGASYLDGHEIGDHTYRWGRHGWGQQGWGQLVYAASGAIKVVAERVRWLVPSGRAVWLPARSAHRLTMHGPASLKTLFVASEHCQALPNRCRGLEVQPLLREVILHVVGSGILDSSVRTQAVFAELLENLIEEAAVIPFSLRLPTDARARRAAQMIQGTPAAQLALVDLAGAAGVSVRTLQRLFLQETGVHVAEWRQTARIMTATARLVTGASVTEAGLAAGYATPGAFINAFQQRTGQTPLEYRPAKAAAR